MKDPSIGIKEIKTKARAALKETAAQYVEALSKVECPLDPNIDLKELVLVYCWLFIGLKKLSYTSIFDLRLFLLFTNETVWYYNFVYYKK